VRRHFEREYGPPRAACGPVAVEADVAFGRRADSPDAAGGHKTARWRIALSDPSERPLRVRLRLFGGPPSFALSLVQGYYVEPLVSMALARAGFAALPSAGIVAGDAALVVAGHSGSGKSSLSVRALARGLTILGDDQVVVGRDGGCWAYPRRLRLYPDVRHTAPEAWPRLPRRTRATLLARDAIRRLSRGFVAPSLTVPIAHVGGAARRDRVAAARLVFVQRSDDVDSVIELTHEPAWACARAAELLAAQRSRFAAAAGARWAPALREVAEAEAAAAPDAYGNSMHRTSVDPEPRCWEPVV
jgi:hypothetical protein